MVNFDNLAATSKAAGFEYYDIQDINFTVPGQTLAKFTGTTQNYTGTQTLPKNRLGKALTSQILTNAVVHLDPIHTAGNYYPVAGALTDNVTLGSSGGFPIFYYYTLNLSADANNVIVDLNIANPSAVNAVTVPDITVTGRMFMYLAPF